MISRDGVVGNLSIAFSELDLGRLILIFLSQHIQIPIFLLKEDQILFLHRSRSIRNVQRIIP
jgi:hypothetical protein